MKKLLLLIIIGCLTHYGFSVNPIDPPVKSGDNLKTIAPISPMTTDECSNLYSVVPVTVVLTITDCPSFKCSVPDTNCTIQLCIYQDNCNGSPLACTAFDPTNCTYYIDVRADEHHNLYSKLVVTGCTNLWNTACESCSAVPQGGGTVYCSRVFCP